ncbi:FtsX-like permease family protein [uncultured Treponema sp.]|uniref:ABC transporter permease n=1 Tax=uncultured Treponema sp. TaxID=162155 RepID=UPI0025F31CA6|nr:FtsX-like permease family protein [uncultured Treponema sp.]
MYQTKIALRSLIYRKTQYVSLFLVCMFGVAISLAAISISTGMIRSLNQKARIYYGGDFALMCSVNDDGLEIFDYEEKLALVKSVMPDDAVVTERMDFDARHSSFYFEGTQALQQTIKGVKFANEADLISSFIFVEGGLDNLDDFAEGSNAVLISAPIAKMMNVHVGDEITFQLETYDDYINTVQVEVKGIFQDSSVFGMYTSYMDFDFLKEAYGRPKNFANRICVNFNKRKITEKDLHSFYDSLSGVFNMYPWVDDKDDYIDATEDFKEETWGFIPLSANLNDVEIMELAMDAVISFIVVILTIIIIAGIGSTYRVLIMKRITEIGIYMAVGMKKRSIIATLLFESFLLLVAGCFAGLILSGLLCSLLSVFDFSFIPSFDMFLEKGNLSPRMDVIKSVSVIVSVITVTLLAVLYSTLKSIKIMPVEALAVTE